MGVGARSHRDGTASFVSGIPLWGALIGLLCEGRPVLGLLGYFCG